MKEASATVEAAIGIQRLNIYDNDEFDIMTNDTIDTSKIHRGKRYVNIFFSKCSGNSSDIILHCKNSFLYQLGSANLILMEPCK